MPSTTRTTRALKPTRWAVVCRSLALLALASIAGPAAAQTYPDHPIRLIVGFPPGQPSDATARSIAARMSETLKQTVFVDNRPGAAGIIAHEAVKHSAADGYTLVMGSTSTLSINPALYRKLPYDPLKDFEPVAMVAAAPLVLFTSADVPVANLKEMIAYVKARPGKVSYGSPGNGASAHITMELLKDAAGIDLLHVPYKGSPPMIGDVIGGRIEFAFEPALTIVPQAKNGRVKLLGVTSAKRMEVAPELPTLAEQGLPGFEASAWTAVMAPKGTPPAIVQALSTAINLALKDAAVVAELQRTGAYPLGGSTAETRRFVQSEIERWGKAVKASGAQID